MPVRLSRSKERLTPDPWRYALETFEEQLEEGAPPDLSPCLRLFKGDLIPLLSELVATYQSYRALHGGSSANAIGELIHANPDMRSQISRAVGELSTAQLELPSTGVKKEGELPRRIGGYLLVGNLGIGGFSEVYLGCSPSRAEFVVIKIARTDIEWSDVARESLQQEKLALIQLQGLKGTPEFVDWDDDSEGSVALVTKFVDAQPLDRVCEAENPSVELLGITAMKATYQPATLRLKEGLRYALVDDVNRWRLALSC